MSNKVKRELPWSWHRSPGWRGQSYQATFNDLYECESGEKTGHYWRDPSETMTSGHGDLTYSMTLDLIKIVDFNLGNKSVTNDIEHVLRKIGAWHQGSIAGF